ncbi:uncharacterized protein LOC122529569 isoform X1 [Frieseomelitta varia]|uniref:uncharacterized protein LOC122529569 isoform X1 n=1 Tax=Frieseomelitta varia TaxID=561572 RepID=UPI001CB689C2|nr:uncharacterized protein LOC122529569 isoform X1 [Frieseomelitta varia]XP_043511763.1 uncharacterized protein LOC122529569 isoform X1 [Frieseomelitta varia]XP_043511764.1 uncharacterized protein LOC122529569 isoform X1 [Frieseomelitta varia]
MSTSATRKSKIWKYFHHIDRDKTFSKAKCTLCDYSTDYNGNIRPLRKHLYQHIDQIKELEEDSEDSNLNVSSHNCTEKTGNAATIIETVDSTASNYDYYRDLMNAEIMRQAKLLFQAPAIEKDSPNSIGAFVKDTRTYLDSLKSSNIPVDTWEMILHIRPKLYGNTDLYYNKTLKSDDIPTLNQLLEFLTERARCDMTTNYSIPNHEQASNSQRSSAQDIRRKQSNFFTDSRYERSSSPRPSTSQSQTIHQSSRVL